MLWIINITTIKTVFVRAQDIQQTTLFAYGFMASKKLSKEECFEQCNYCTYKCMSCTLTEISGGTSEALQSQVLWINQVLFVKCCVSKSDWKVKLLMDLWNVSCDLMYLVFTHCITVCLIFHVCLLQQSHGVSPLDCIFSLIIRWCLQTSYALFI